MAKKIILDFAGKFSADSIHSYIAEALGFPDYYGKNLDALYDCLSDIGEDTCIGVFNLEPGDTLHRGIMQVMKDAEIDNPSLCLIFSNLSLN